MKQEYSKNTSRVELRHSFTVRTMKEIHVFVQSSNSSERYQLVKSTLKGFLTIHANVTLPW